MMNDTVILSFSHEIWSKIDEKRGRISRTDFLQHFVVSRLGKFTKPSCSLDRWLKIDEGNFY